VRSASLATQAALQGARDNGIVPRNFLWLTVKELGTGVAASFGLWSGDDPIEITVISGTTGLPVTRTYVGGVNLEVGEITRVSDLTVQTLEISLSGISDSVKNIIRNHDARLAKIELHACQLDTVSREPVDAPEIDFLGELDGAPIETPAAGGEAKVELRIVSDAISMLTRTNPRKRSYEGQKIRSGDELSRYSNAVGSWQVMWGEVQQ